jgi:hypothetical protein
MQSKMIPAFGRISKYAVAIYLIDFPDLDTKKHLLNLLFKK